MTRNTWFTLLVALLLSVTGAYTPAGADDGATETVSITIPVAAPTVSTTATGQDLTVQELGSLLVPGKPKLPSKIFSVAIPPGAEFVSVSFEGAGEILPGSYDVAPSPLFRVIGQEDPVIAAQRQQECDENYQSVYEADAPYPASPVEFVRTAGYRKYNLVDIRVTPFSYRPLSRELTYYPRLTLNVEYTPARQGGEVMIDNLTKREVVAQEIISNYQEAQNWYPRSGGSRGIYDFVVITIDSLTTTVQPLVDYEIVKGRTVQVVTTSWINSNYTGYDLAEKIRNFLREKYPSGEWGIEDVLIVGHYDDVPMRRTAQDVGYGEPETDYYYAELTFADSQSWDSNQNHQWGEDSDSIDFYAEVNVGRIPWSSTSTVSHICQKSVAYEQNTDPGFKKNILLLGGFFWDNDPNPRTDNAVLMETKVNQTWMADWTMTRMYEQGYSTYAMDYNLNWSNVRSVWSSGTYAFVNWAGHGSPTSSHIYHGTGEAFVDTGTCNYLNDDYPAIVFADACSNSDTDYTNLGQEMLAQGAVGFVGATKVAMGCPGWNHPNDGSSQSLDYYFTADVTSGDYTQGEAHQRALRQMYVDGLWGDNKYETFEWGALWGNPNLGMATGIAPLVISFPEGLPENILPNVPTEITVEITDGSESYEPGTGRLHYRYYGGSFLNSTLTHDTGDLYIATLPATDCAAAPQFYFSAHGDQGSIIVNPSSAPSTFYSATVGTATVFYETNFESAAGWTVENSAGLGDGPWDRGIPVNCDRGDPPSDYDGSGQCFLTDNSSADDCNSDVDDGYTWLLSPTLDLSSGGGEVSFAVWYDNSYGADPHNDLFNIYVSNNNGGNWTLVETLGPTTSSGWSMHSFEVSDFVTPTSQVKVRFEASDLNSGSVVEAGIDDFSVAAFNCDDGPPEACCYENGSCQDISPFTCEAQGGTAQGVGSDCATADCPQPPQACCFGDTSCLDLEPSECETQGGTPWGVGTSCATATCPPEDERVVNITFDPAVNPDSVCPGATFDVTVQLSSLNGDMEDVRLMQFVALLSSGNLTLNSVTWDLQLTDMGLYNMDSDLGDPYQLFSAAYTAMGRVAGFIVDLDGSPQTVAHLNITYNGGDATLNLLGNIADESDHAAWFRSGFDSVVDYQQSNGRIAGGSLTFHEGSCASVHIVSSDPGDGWIDARRPTNLDGSGDFGWSAVDVTFDGDASGLTPADFTTSETCEAGACDGSAPGVTSVDGTGATVTVTLERPIDPVAWTSIALVGGDPTDVIRLGYLPADADASLAANANDILKVVDAVNAGGELYHYDIDRSGMITANDIVELINLLNGASGYDAYFGQTLPAMP